MSFEQHILEGVKLHPQRAITYSLLFGVIFAMLISYIWFGCSFMKSGFSPCSYTKNDGQILTMTAGDLTMQVDDRPGQEHTGPGGLDDLDQTMCDGASLSRFSSRKPFLNDRGGGPEFWSTSSADADFWSSELSATPGVISDDMASAMAAPMGAAATVVDSSSAATDAAAAAAAAQAAASVVSPAAAPAAAQAAVSRFYANKATQRPFKAQHKQPFTKGKGHYASQSPMQLLGGVQPHH